MGQLQNDDELQPFLTAFGDTHGKQHYQEYLQWKQKHGLDDHHDDHDEEKEMATILKDDDKALWEFCLAKACHIHHQHLKGEKVDQNSATTGGNGTNGADADTSSSPKNKEKKHHHFHNPFHLRKWKHGKHHDHDLPVSKAQIIFAPRVNGHDDEENKLQQQNDTVLRCKDGHRILFLLPARLEENLKEHAEVLISTLAMFVYYIAIWKKREEETTTSQQEQPRQQNHHSHEKLTILLDSRGGRGWPNAPGLRLVSFVKTLLQRLYPLFPDVLHTLICFPAPRILVWVWGGILKPFLPKIVAEKDRMKILAGPDSMDDPMPASLENYVDQVQLDRLEALRVSHFEEEPDADEEV